MSVDFNTNLNVANNASSDSASGVQTKTTSPINLSAGTITVDENPETLNSIINSGSELFTNNKLTKPSYELADLGNITIPIDSEAAESLGTKNGELSVSEFINVCTNKLVESGVVQKSTATQETKNTPSTTSNTSTENEIDLTKLSAESLALLCLLMTQSSKSKLIDTLKNALNSKFNERKNTNDELIANKEQSAKEITESIKAQKKSKVRGIFKAIFSAIGALIGVAIAVATTVMTAGGSSFFMAAACVGLGCAIAGGICSCVSSGLTIASLCTDDPNAQKALGKANMIIGITGAIVGLGSVICSCGSSIVGFLTKAPKIAAEVSTKVIKLIKTGGALLQAATTAEEGSLQIADGVENIKLAKALAQAADAKIRIEELDAEIKILSEAIENIQSFLEMFIKNMLEAEEKAASTINDSANNMLGIANKIA